MKDNALKPKLCPETMPAGSIAHDPSCARCDGSARLIDFRLLEIDPWKHLPGMKCADFLNAMAIMCRLANDTWWRDPNTGESITRNKGELLALIHSEISECLEGERKNLQDDHLPHRPMAEVELADAIIRIMDYAGEYGYDIGGALVEKMAYNANRKDHKPESRRDGGKQF